MDIFTESMYESGFLERPSKSWLEWIMCQLFYACIVVTGIKFGRYFTNKIWPRAEPVPVIVEEPNEDLTMGQHVRPKTQ